MKVELTADVYHRKPEAKDYPTVRVKWDDLDGEDNNFWLDLDPGRSRKMKEELRKKFGGFVPNWVATDPQIAEINGRRLEAPDPRSLIDRLNPELQKRGFTKVTRKSALTSPKVFPSEHEDSIFNTEEILIITYEPLFPKAKARYHEWIEEIRRRGEELTEEKLDKLSEISMEI